MIKSGTIKEINGVKVLVLDHVVDDQYFVLAYDLTIRSIFDDDTNWYPDSYLKEVCDQWLEQSRIKTIARSLDLLTLTGDKQETIQVNAAPLTLDEYRKYYAIIKPYITHNFWLSTSYNYADLVCVVYSGGTAYNSYYDSSYCLAPAFVVDFSNQNSLDAFTTEELLNEIIKRTRG